MTPLRWNRYVTLVLALMVAVVVAACESPTAVEDEAVLADEELAAVAGQLTQELSLTTAQASDVQGAFAQHERRRHEPGFLWYVAADLQQTLTDEQKAELFERTEGFEGRGGFPGIHGGPGGSRGFGGPHGHRLPNILDILSDLLTEDQVVAIEAIRDRYKEQFQALMQRRRDGTLTPEDFRTEAQALHEAMKAEVEAVLTADQIAALEALLEERRAEMEAKVEERRAEMEARREEAKAAMVEVLGLSDADLAELDALLTSFREARKALLEQFRSDEIDQEALAAALDGLRADEEAALADFFDATQHEVWQIHRALRVRMAMHHGPQGGHRGPGHGGPQPGGPFGGGPFGGGSTGG